MQQFLNPLHTPEWIASNIRTQGRFDLTRCTGRTTARAMKAIAEAIESPFTWVTLIDHKVEGVSYGQLDVNIMHRVKMICDALELKHMYIERIGGKYKLSFGKAQ